MQFSVCAPACLLELCRHYVRGEGGGGGSSCVLFVPLSVGLMLLN